MYNECRRNHFEWHQPSWQDILHTWKVWMVCIIYNKMVQMLESKYVGHSWNNWVCQKEKRFAKSHDLCKDCGSAPTHVEVPLSCKDDVPSDIVINNCLKHIIETISPFPVYSTSFVDIWRAYCDALLHSLVVVNQTLKGCVGHLYLQRDHKRYNCPIF